MLVRASDRHLSKTTRTFLATLWLVGTSLCTQFAYGANRPIDIEDILNLRKVAAISVSPHGDAVAYIVVHAVLAHDAYSISLVVTSASATSEHEEVISLQVPARSSEVSGMNLDVGSDITGDLVFDFTRDGKDLVYGVPSHNNTEVYLYSVSLHRKERAAIIPGRLTAIKANSEQLLSYCSQASVSAPSRTASVVDPAYRYAHASFSSISKEPWRNVQGSSERPYAVHTECFARELNTGKERKVSLASMRSYDPTRFTRLAGPRVYKGEPVDMALPSPDNSLTLYGADAPSTSESSSGGRALLAKVFFVEDSKQSAPAQRHLFDTRDWTEGGVTSIFWAHDSKSIFYFRRFLSHTQLFCLDLSTYKADQVMDTDWGIADNHLKVSPDGHFLYAVRERPNVPKELCRIDLRTGEMLLIDDINGQFTQIAVPSFTPIKHTSPDGHELIGYLFLPPGYDGHTRLPFVAIKGAHYGAFCDGGDGVEFPGLAMAMNGYAVLFFMPDTFRSGPSLVGDATYSLKEFTRPLASLEALLDEFNRKGWIDPQKTGIAGLSYGADIVDYAAGFSKLFSVGSATTGEGPAPANYFILGQAADEAFTKRWGLSYPDAKNLSSWQKVSASLNAPQSQVPLLFQPPDSEAWSTIPQDLAWQHARIPVEMYVYPDEGHIKIHPLNRYFVLSRNMQWFDFWLRGREDSAAMFADQYTRWRQMRDQWQQYTRANAR